MFPPPLRGRIKEGGHAVLGEKRAVSHSVIALVCATPHPCPPPQEGAGALTPSILRQAKLRSRRQPAPGPAFVWLN